MKSFNKLFESMLTKPAMPTWDAPLTPTPAPAQRLVPVGPESMWTWGG